MYKKFYIIVLLFLLAAGRSYSQYDVSVRLSEAEINQALLALIESRNLNYGEYPGNFLERWFVNLDNASINIRPNNSFLLPCTLAVNTRFDLYVIQPQIVVHPDGYFSGHFYIQGDAQNGYKLVVAFDDHNFDLITDAVIGDIPDYAINLGTNLLPNAIAGMFTTQVPQITTTESEIIIGWDFVGPRNVKVQNDYEGNTAVGSIESYETVNGSLQWVSYLSPRSFWWDKNSTHSIRAKSAVHTYNNATWKFYNWNNSSAQTAPQKTVTADIDKTETAYFKKVAGLNLRSYMTEANLNGSIKINGTSYNTPLTDYIFMSPITTTVEAPAVQAINSKTYSFLNWTDGSTSNVRTLSPSAPVNLTANYKGNFLSNNANTFANNGQRKIAKADYSDSWVHMVYESMGQIWYKYSTDNGTTWSSEKLVGQGSSPSIDAYTDSHTIGTYDPYIPTAVIVYQSVSETDAFIHMDTYVRGSLQSAEIVDSPWWIMEGGTPPTFDYMPLISAGPAHRLVVWKPSATTGLYYRYCTKSSEDVLNWGTKQLLPGTNGSSVNASIATDPAYYQNGYIVYQQNANYNSSYIYLKSFFTQPLSFGNTITITPNKEGDYYYLNHHPCVISTGNRFPYVAWIQYHPVTYMNAAMLKYQTTSTTWSPVYSYGGASGEDEAEVISLHLSTVGGATVPTFVLAFADANGANNMYVKGSDLNSLYSSNTSGKQLQVMGGASASAAKIVSFYNTSLPYYFQFSNGLSGLAKSGETLATFNDRVLQGVSNNAVVDFGIGNIAINGGQVKFETLNDTVEAAALNKLNNFIISEEFAVNKSAALTYKLITGVSNFDSALTANMSDTENLKLTTELIDAKTGKILKTLNALDYNKRTGNISYGDIYYKVENIEFDGQAKLRIGIVNNLQDKDIKFTIHKYSYPNKQNSDKNYEKIDGNETVKIESYALSQNYPNPFNPSTVISYDIPEASRVTLKVYDILGREVADLVNEFKEAGRYNVKFDASHLSTGIYIYQLRANDYVSVKKMSFVK